MYSLIQFPERTHNQVNSTVNNITEFSGPCNIKNCKLDFIIIQILNLDIQINVWWHDATLFVYFSYFFITYIHTFIQSHSSVAIRCGLSPFLHRLFAQWGNLPVVPSRESNSGLPYSKPTRYQLSHAAPCWATPHHTEPRRTINWATPHHRHTNTLMNNTYARIH